MLRCSTRDFILQKEESVYAVEAGLMIRTIMEYVCMERIRISVKSHRN